MIKKKRKKHDKIVLLAKSNLNNFLNNVKYPERTL